MKYRDKKGKFVKKVDILKNCLVCKKEFRVEEYRKSSAKYCSFDCYHLGTTKENPSYGSLHDWVKQRLGRPSKCEFCKTTTAKKFEWANKSHKYKRSLEDWIRLCTKCHSNYDRKGIYANFS